MDAEQDDSIEQADEQAQLLADRVREDHAHVRHLAALVPELRAMTELEGTDLAVRTRLAAHRAMIACCERIGRIMKRDLPGSQA